MSHSVIRAAVLYNFTTNKYMKINQAVDSNPLHATGTWVDSPNDATRWVNMIELEYYLINTILGDPLNLSYPCEIKWMYFIN